MFTGRVTSASAAPRSMDRGAADALVTLPVNKAQLKSAGMDHAGHTELFRARYPQSELVMSFRSDERPSTSYRLVRWTLPRPRHLGHLELSM